MAAKFEISSAGAGRFNWALKSQGRTLATGESYPRRAAAEKAIESLRRAVGGATVSDLTVKPTPARAKATNPAEATRAARKGGTARRRTGATG
jgi:uncharacterized protein YegP (UPF0339 family)